MRCLISYILMMFFFACTNAKKENSQESVGDKKIGVEKVWQTDTVFSIPEAVLFDSIQNVVYVANINGKAWAQDGNGFISKIGLDGEIIELKWSEGLDAPKGMGISGQSLFVADCDKIVEIDLSNGDIVNRYPVDVKNPGLNDISVAKGGDVYASGSFSESVFKIESGNIITWKMDSFFQIPNGIRVEDSRLLLLGSESHKLFSIDMFSKQVEELADSLGHADGIVHLGGKQYLVSGWHGELFAVNESGESYLILNTKDENVMAADIDYVPNADLVIVPTFLDNRVMAYHIMR